MARIDNEADGDLRFEVRLMIKHPAMSPDEITSALGWLPSGPCFCVGAPRAAPNGRPIAGLYQETMWSDSEKHEGSRNFFSPFISKISRLKRASGPLEQILASGGTAVLMVYLPGDVNIGATLHPADLRSLSDLGVKLGIEVFPNLP